MSCCQSAVPSSLTPSTTLMPTAIAGMHRSGTSLVSHALAIAGLRLGAESDLIPANADNLDGYWEHRGFVEINDQILARLGGSWEAPPARRVGWLDHERLDDLRDAASALVAELQQDAGEWGWKDPRNSLTLPFWLDLIPDLRVVICVRNPLEVARSLDRRGSFSLKFSFRLWEVYTERLLDAAPRRRTLVTSYESWFADPLREVERLADFTGLDLDRASVERAAAVVSPELRHQASSVGELGDMWGVDDLVERYEALSRVASLSAGSVVSSGGAG